MESLRSVRVRQQGARARRKPCPSRGSGQAQAVEPGGAHQYMAHHGRAVTRVLDLPARGNQRVPGGEHRPLASFIALLAGFMLLDW